MSQLREQMMMDMDLKGFSPSTKESYIKHVEKFSKHFMNSPEKLGEAEIKQYLHYLLTQAKMSQSYNSQAYSAIKFLYETTLKRDWKGFKYRGVREIRNYLLYYPVKKSKEYLTLPKIPNTG